jgi:hypothetical protein
MGEELWTLEAVDEIVKLAREGVPVSVISMKLGRDVADVEAKLTELGITVRRGGKRREEPSPKR